MAAITAAPGAAGSRLYSGSPATWRSSESQSDSVVHQIIAFHPVGMVLGQQSAGGGEAVEVEGASRRGGVPRF